MSPILLWAFLAAMSPTLAAPPADPGAEDAKEEEQPPEEIELRKGVYQLMHRTQAMAPLADGWHRAKSTEGGFSVDLPLRFNDFRMREKDEDKVEVVTYTVGTRTRGLLSYTAACTRRVDGSLTPEMAALPKDAIEKLEVPLDGYKRTIRLDDRVCILTVEARGSDPLPAEDQRRRFLMSLKWL